MIKWEAVRLQKANAKPLHLRKRERHSEGIEKHKVPSGLNDNINVIYNIIMININTKVPKTAQNTLNAFSQVTKRLTFLDLTAILLPM